MHVEISDWRDGSVDWADAAVTVLRSPWDYVDAVDEFVAWVRATGAATALWNPPALVAWNVHKSYVLELADTGAPIVPTVLLLRGSAAALDGISDAQGWNTVVVKPAIGIGALGRRDASRSATRPGKRISTRCSNGVTCSCSRYVTTITPTVSCRSC